MLWGAAYFMGLVGGGRVRVVGHLAVYNALRVFAKPWVLEGVDVSNVSKWGADEHVGTLTG